MTEDLWKEFFKYYGNDHLVNGWTVNEVYERFRARLMYDLYAAMPASPGADRVVEEIPLEMRRE